MIIKQRKMKKKKENLPYFTAPADNEVKIKVSEKRDKYLDLVSELRQL